MSSAALDVVDESAQYRRELVAYCYRMLGAASEAEDAAQETLVRAWRGGDTFEGRSALRSWLYRIATNVCIDMQRAPQRRALPMDLNGPSSVDSGTNVKFIGAPLEETVWIGPIHDSRVLPDRCDPAEGAVLRDSVRLAFVAALQHLPPKQRAVLVLREVLAMSAAEVAELLEISVDSVTSALARARATMSKIDPRSGGRALDDGDRSLLDRYVTAFEAYDVTTLVSLLREDAVFSMPPFTFWLRGVEDIERWWTGPGDVCRGSKMVLTRANGGPAVAAYHPVGPGRWEPFGLHLLEVRDGRIASICHFLDTSDFADFGLPPEITEIGEIGN
jgi:RNA polymerase sigma-70 factor (ECF subfamily)